MLKKFYPRVEMKICCRAEFITYACLFSKIMIDIYFIFFHSFTELAENVFQLCRRLMFPSILHKLAGYISSLLRRAESQVAVRERLAHGKSIKIVGVCKEKKGYGEVSHWAVTRSIDRSLSLSLV